VPRRFQNVHQNFATGEITPRMALRVDTNAYGNALSRSLNWIISSQGGAAFREGLQYIGPAPSNQPFRLFQFHRGGDKSDILIEVSEGLIRYWIDDAASGMPYLAVDLFTLLSDEDDGELLTDEDDGEFLSVGVMLGTNPYSLEDLEGLYFTNQDKYGVLCHPNHPPLYITIERTGAITATLIPQERIPPFAYSDAYSPSLASEVGNWIITFPATWADKSYLYFMTYNGIQANIEVTGMGISYAFNATPDTNRANIQAGLIAAATRQGLTTTFAVTVGSDAFTYVVAVSGADSGYVVDTKIGYWPYYVQGITNQVIATDPPVTQPVTEGSDATEEPAWSYPCYVLHNDVYYRCIAVHKSETDSVIDNEPGVGAEWEAFWADVGIAKPIGFDYQYPDGNDWAGGVIYSPQNRGFPTVCVFNDQRLILMANPDNPTALYGSQLGYYFNFKPGVNDDDPFLFLLDSSDTPQIKWARSQRNLTLGTSSGEWSITADVTITPTDIHAEQQNNARSHLSIPVQVDTEIFYIEQGGRKLRATQYFDQPASLTSIDGSLMAEHLISKVGIKRVIASYIPEVFLVLLRNDGQLVFLTYEKSQPIMAFTEQLTDGTIHDCASYFAFNANRDYTYYAVERNGRFVLERLRYPCSKLCTPLTQNQVVHLDGWVTGIVAGSTITGLDHLNGKVVSVLLDDAWQIGTFVVGAGQLTLPEDRTGALYAVGLPYTGELTTFETPDNDTGTGLGTKRRWNRLFVRLLNSALPRIYTERASDRTPATPMNESENVREGLQDIEKSTVGYGDGSLTVIVDRPYPCHVLGFFGEYQVEDR
jgi:hypothetical protein